ncbi:MAG: hypothetical protein SGI88_13580 [Candidatus Hydrogenedentes bacterium]|nr:hypothetical protein [Candidatus Hydrogenedentota bacterium]
MSTFYRLGFFGLVIGLLAAPVSWADHSAHCGSKSCGAHCAKSHANCTAECCAPTEFKDPANVHWVHKRVSFGNYMKMAAAEVPAVVLPAPVTFGPVFFDFKKTHLRPESVESCYQLIEFMKAHPSQTVLIDGTNAKMGARRAEIVKSFLMENGIPASRITTNADPAKNPTANIHVRVGESPR